MICVLILLPVVDKRGHARPYHLFGVVQEELTAKFGGVTAFINAPAEGRWKKNRRTVHDDICCDRSHGQAPQPFMVAALQARSGTAIQTGGDRRQGAADAVALTGFLRPSVIKERDEES